MSAAEIAAALGGAHRSGRWWRAVCPIHGSRTGHSATLALTDGNRDLIVKCHANCSRADILAELRRRGLVCADNSRGLVRSSSAARRPDDRADITRRIEAARRIWNAAQQPRGTPIEHYLAGRDITTPPPLSLRWAPRCWHRAARKPSCPRWSRRSSISPAN